ncbi:hypothetical protein GCM10011360_19100 [Primorskyibacter flagellatus]|uniref:Uncharacterized protein n=1 Tax=Primorskyibacter flagellatus TaxID=1387277 RepID=A0A917A6K1_9RHOB|nr:hypothetical protein [Primorskyibacter flagellatus]GGE31338.1 hypothetical protein GCM10011360_19100 [Primorskyibacter flagellatus]
MSLSGWISRLTGGPGPKLPDPGAALAEPVPEVVRPEMFREFQLRLGRLKPVTTMGIVGYDAGGPVSMVETVDGQSFVTTELCDRTERARSREGQRYELALHGRVPADWAQEALTLLARYFETVPVGDNEAVGIPAIGDHGAVQGLVSLMPSGVEGQAFYVVSILEGTRQSGGYAA